MLGSLLKDDNTDLRKCAYPWNRSWNPLHFILLYLAFHEHSSAYWLWLSLYPLFLQLCFIIILSSPSSFFFSNIADKSPILDFFLLREIRGSYENRRGKWGSPLKEHSDRNKIYSYLLLAKCLDSNQGVVFCWVTSYFVVFELLIHLNFKASLTQSGRKNSLLAILPFQGYSVDVS